MENLSNTVDCVQRRGGKRLQLRCAQRGAPPTSTCRHGGAPGTGLSQLSQGESVGAGGLRGQAQRSRVSWIQILTPDMPPPGKSDHRAESAPGGRGETLDGVSARGGVSEQPGQDCHPGRCPGVPVPAGGGPLA